MDKIYYFDTIEECKKQIMDKSLLLDITHSTNANLLECGIRTVRTVLTWITIVGSIVMYIKNGFKLSFQFIILMTLIYLLICLLGSWVKFNYNEAYNNMKVNLVNNLAKLCKEYQDGEYEEWQKNQILKEFAIMAHINIK